MYNHWKIREFIAKIAAIFGTNRNMRRQIRDRIRFRGLIRDVGVYDAPRTKFPRRIAIALCFDGNGYKLAAVTIRSLVMAATDRCDYDIYCITDQTVMPEYRRILGRMVADTQSTITFIDANDDFDTAHRRRWPVAVYYRMMLPKLLPDIDQIIYADIDTIFCRDLIDLACLDMGDNLVAGVADYANGYINSGVLVMNLKQMRDEKIYDTWVRAAHEKDYKNPDQDLLNYTTRGRKIYLPLRYNFQSMLGKRLFQVHTEHEFDDLRHGLVIIHYSNWMKPWHAPEKRPVYANLWWDIARQTGLYSISGIRSYIK